MRTGPLVIEGYRLCKVQCVQIECEVEPKRPLEFLVMARDLDEARWTVRRQGFGDSWGIASLEVNVRQPAHWFYATDVNDD